MKLATVEEARARMLAAVPAPQAGGDSGVVAETIKAKRDQPPFDASAMDGWAIRRADAAEGEVRLRIVGESAAGSGYAAGLNPGEAVRIFTGAPVPEGADWVCIQEEARREGDVVVLGPLKGRDNIRPRGGDFRAGDGLLEPGLRLDPWRLSLAAAAGCGQVPQTRRPSVVVLATGDEVVEPGEAPEPHQIYNSGAPGLAALIRQWGGAPIRLKPARDTEAALIEAVEGAASDLIVTIGGASVGDHDLVKPALKRLGLELMVESVAVRPGKPTWFGRLSDGRLVLGLPGNPASAFVCAELFLRPILAKWTGADPALAMSRARLATALPANGPREHWMRASLSVSDDGVQTATAFSDQESSLVSVFARADALLRRPANAPAAAVGDVVEVLRLDRG